MFHKLIIIIFALFLCHQKIRLTMAAYASDCLTTTNEAGKCLPLYSCKNLLSILQEANKSNTTISDADRLYLRNSYCGTFNDVPHACCANDQIQLNRVGLEILQNSICGNYSDPKVAHGQQAKLSSFPWMALLKYNRGKTFRCGGTLITNRYVLTAAHCVKGYEKELTEVRLGEHDLSTSTDCISVRSKQYCAPTFEDVGIAKHILHENYHYIIANDIALLRLSRKVEFKKHIVPICLPIDTELMIKKPRFYLVAGWGLTENNYSSNVLMYANVPDRTNGECESAFKQLRGRLNDGFICAGGMNGVDSCKGDSGGPLKQIDLYNGKLLMVQFGIVSSGVITCGQESFPALYTNVSYYMQWISDNIER